MRSRRRINRISDEMKDLYASLLEASLPIFSPDIVEAPLEFLPFAAPVPPAVQPWFSLTPRQQHARSPARACGHKP